MRSSLSWSLQRSGPGPAAPAACPSLSSVCCPSLSRRPRLKKAATSFLCSVCGHSGSMESTLSSESRASAWCPMALSRLSRMGTGLLVWGKDWQMLMQPLDRKGSLLSIGCRRPGRRSWCSERAATHVEAQRGQRHSSGYWRKPDALPSCPVQHLCGLPRFLLPYSTCSSQGAMQSPLSRWEGA